MSELALSLLLSGFVCPPIPCAEIMHDNELIMCCVNGQAYEPVTMCGDRCVRVDVDSDGVEILAEK